MARKSFHDRAIESHLPVGLIGRGPRGGRRPRVRGVTCWPLRLNGRPQDFRPVWTFFSGILLGGNKHLETLERSDGLESRL